MYLFVFNKESVSKNVFWPLLTWICISSSHHQHTSCTPMFSSFQLTAANCSCRRKGHKRSNSVEAPARSNTQPQSRFRFHQFNQSSFHWVFWEVFAIVSFNNLVAGRRSVVVSAATVFEEGTKFLSVVTQVQDHRPKDSQSRGARHNLQDTPEVLLCESVSGQ